MRGLFIEVRKQGYEQYLIRENFVSLPKINLIYKFNDYAEEVFAAVPCLAIY